MSISLGNVATYRAFMYKFPQTLAQNYKNSQQQFAVSMLQSNETQREGDRTALPQEEEAYSSIFNANLVRVANHDPPCHNQRVIF